MDFSNLKNKKILFFSVRTFDLEKEIEAKLNQYGASVDYYDERPSNTIIVKGLIRLKKSLYLKRINKYYNTILIEIKGKKYDYLFVNRGEVMPSFFLEEFKKTQQKCTFIFYTWDSFKNNKHPLKILKYFDKTISFDYHDANNYNLKFRPLFFIDNYRLVNSQKGKIKYDLSFIGTAHSDRYLLAEKIFNWCDKKQFKSFAYFYSQGFFVFLFKKIFDKSFKDFRLTKINFKSLKQTEIIKIYNCSNVILDINHPLQTGLTLRTFECLGAKKKIITTNGEIKKYPFFNPNNIQIIDRNKPIIDEKIFHTDYQDIDPIVYEELSISGWIYDIFLDKELTKWQKKYKI